MKSILGKDRWQLYPLFFLAAIEIYALCLSGMHKVFNKDEIEHIHSAWYVAHGFVPFRDFFQHHNPLLWYLIAPAIAILGDNAGLVMYLRMIMVGLALCTAVVASLIAARVSSRFEAGMYCFILLLSSLMFSEKAVEIRPDVPMMLFEAVSVYFLIRFLDTAECRDIVLSGLSASIAFLFLQKAVFFYAAVSLFTMGLLFTGQVKIKPLICFFSSLMAGPILCFVYAAMNGALYDYYLCGYLLNVSKTQSFGPWSIMKKSLISNAGFWAVTFAGLIFGLCSFKDNKKLGFVSMLGVLLLLSLNILTSPWKHNFLPALVFMSIAGSCVLVRVTGKARAGVLIGSIIIAAMIYRPVMYDLMHYKRSQNRPQMKRIEYVIRNTREGDLVYDGDNTFNLFRGDLHYFWYSTGKGFNLEAYNRINKDRFADYDICNLISKKKPRIASDYLVDAVGCKAFGMYDRVGIFGLYKLREKP